MAVADALPSKGGKKGPAVAIAIKPAPLSHAVDDAAAQILKCVHGNDSAGLADAIRMAFQACQDEWEQQGKDDKGGDDSGEY